MDWTAWTEMVKPQIAAICRGEPDPLPTIRPLQEIIEDTAGLPRVTAKRCIQVAASLSNLRPEDLTGRRQTANYVAARDLAVVLILDRCPHLVLIEVGRALDRDHKTIMASRDRGVARMKNPEFVALYRRARAAL